MKFWELTSAFREEPDIILQVLKKYKSTKYYENYLKLEEIVFKQQRNILDEELPFELCYEIAAKSSIEYWLSFDSYPQVLYNYKPNIEMTERLLPSEVLVRFGGSKLEEAHEKSEVDVKSRSLDGDAEVIASYNLTKTGLLSTIRTEINVLPDNCILITNDNTRRWKVKCEYKILTVHPFSAFEKLQAQKMQNIRDYLLDGFNHNEKPEPGLILQITNDS